MDFSDGLNCGSVGAAPEIGAAAEKYQTQFRYRGRPVGRRRLIGTTLLVKGLEFEHAIVLDAAGVRLSGSRIHLTWG
jgi:DNA helicase-2/ATP-dependent DNA helicase PcrA